MARYRIYKDNYLGYEARSWRWWWPFWVMVEGCNTFPSYESAERFIKNLTYFEDVKP